MNNIQQLILDRAKYYLRTYPNMSAYQAQLKATKYINKFGDVLA